MLGMIHKVLADMITKNWGQAKWQEILEKAELEKNTEFNINIPYKDSEWQRLYNTTLEVLDINADQASEAYAEAFGQYAIEMFPTWFKMCKNSLEFFKLQPIIHNSFASGQSDPTTRQQIEDKFHIEENSPTHLITHYKSPNQQCVLYKHLASWIIKYYNDEATVIEKKCLKKGDDECQLHIKWSKLTGITCEH